MTYIQLYPKILELLFYNLTFNLKELCTDLLQMLCNRGIYQGHTDKYVPSSLYWHLMKVWNIRSSLIKLPELHLHNNYLIVFINKIFFSKYFILKIQEWHHSFEPVQWPCNHQKQEGWDGERVCSPYKVMIMISKHFLLPYTC